MAEENGLLQWSSPEQTGDIPTRRSGHSLSTCGGRFYLFGGIDQSLPPGPNNQLYCLVPKGDRYEWSKPSAMGEAPAARWRHTATVFDDTKLLIFGGFHSSKERLNDLWMLDTSSMEWSQPANVSGGRGRSRGGRKSGARDGGGAAGDAAKIGRAVGTKDYLDEFGEIVGHGASQFNTDDPDVPTPRGAHSAVLVDRRVVVFGGYGGVEFQRVDFNDSYALDVDSMVWSKLEGISGEPPAPRSGHGAAAVKSTMLVFGGWNVTDKFNDLWSLDMETMAWSHVEGAEYSVPRWNHAALSVSAVPSWQVFLFGGAAMDEEDEDATPAQGLYRNDLAVMDTGAMKWLTLSSNARYDEGEGAGEERKEPEFDPTAVEATGLPPLPRAEPSMAYNPEDKSLVIFGGWANGWQNDLHVMSVGCIIGPPYAIRSVEPVLGPVTGATKLTIKGLGFEPGTTALVKFQIGRKTAESTGQCVDETTIEVDSPNVEAIGPGKAVVRLSMRGHPPTITHASFEYFDVTDPGKSLAFGPGVIDGVSAGHPAEFYIQARDTANLERRTGHDEFVVTVTRVVEGEAGDGEEPETVEAHIHDEENGRYLVKYTAPAPGTYDVAVAFNGTFGAEAGPIRGTPFRVTAVEGDAKNNVFAGGRTLEATKSSVKSVGQFAKKTLEGVTATVGDEDLDGLLSIKKHLVAVAQQDAKTQLDIDTANATLAHLQRTAPKGGNRDADKLVKQLEGHTGTWEEAKKAAPITKASIAPHEKRYTAVTSNELDEYQEQVKRWVMDEGRREFWLFETGHDPAITKLNTARVEFADAKAVLRHKTFLANMFELDDMVKGPQAAFEEVAGEMEQAEALWAVEEECRTYFESCKEGLFSEVDADQMEEDVKKLHKKLKAGVSKRVRTTGVYRGTDQLIKDFLTTVPLIAALTHKSMRPRHWSALMKATNKTFTPPYEDASMKLRALLDLNLHEFAADVEEITDQALKEEKMEQGLEKLKEVWKGADGDAAAGVQFLGEPYKEGSDIMVLKIGEEDFEMLENDQLTVQGMAASRYVAYFEEVVGVWQKELGMVADTLVLLTDIQRTWSYLEPLFIHSEEVKRELPEDAERFAGIDTNVKRILKEAWGVRNVINACNRDGLYGELEGIGEELEVCKKSLADYLDSKRQQFPRFYFVSEADLLDILSNGNTPSKVVAHITKVFLATSTLELDESGGGRPTATKFVSAVGVEEVDFEPAIKLDGKVEIYLQTLLDGQVESLRKRMVRSIARYPTKARTEWLLDRDSSDRAEDPAAVSVLVAGMDYVKTVESTFRSIAGGDEDAMKTTHERIIQDLSDLIRLTQTKLTKPDRRRVMTMITLDAHGRDIVGKMIREGVKEEKSFQWQSQLKQRYADEHARVCILDSTFDYGYEYLGNGARLVITPLTDRIYVTATQALNLKMGCAPAGPAGTGKTETTKDLASALGKCCYVFNCSPEMDYKSMGNIFKGLAASGSWGCFDEFNRLIPEVLSVCSVQFKAVCDSIRLDRDVVTIEGDTVHCDHTAGVFITMNPGYLGRSELPEGLKSLFRPITVMVPDLVLICENMLMAEGFVEAKTLASKFYGLYSLLRELLSKQTHYDWGLRAVKSVLVVAGGFKRAEPDLPEQDLLMRALRDFNTPKIVAQDEVVFFGLLHDLFPGIDPPRKTDPDLEQAVKTATVERGLHPDEFFMLKVVQLEELLEIRHCVFVMGPPGSGKSQCWRTLAGARGVLGNKTKTIDLNPKSVSPSELYGYITMATREWRDGLLSKIMRDLGQEPNTKPKWIILDGDLDANWIESMNSVMDDNKMLTLASNERIPLKAHMRMLFEIRDLAFATPATVSRAGIIYISTNLGSQWRSIIASWVASNPESTPEQKEFTASLFEKYAPDTLLFIKKECRPLVPVEDVTMITNLTRMMDVLLTEEMWKSLAGKGEEEWKHVVETYFVYCAVWAFGSALSVRDGEDYRVRFSEFWRGEFKTVRLPGRETVFDYWLDPEELHFEPWKQSPHFETIEYDSKLTPMNAVTVPTPETCSVTFWMSLLVNSHKPIMLVGYAGCGKTQLVKGLLDSQDPEVRMSTAINFNFYTSAQALQVNLEAPLEKKTGTNFGPPGKKQLIFFVDDLNLPEVDPYNTQSAIALVRQHIDYGHWYDRAKLMVKNVDKCQYIAAMNPTAGSFLVNPRLQRHFVTFAIGFPGPTSLHTIYNTFLSGHLKHFSEDIQALDGAIVNAALGLHAAVAGAFRKSAVNFHYEFNIRHMSNVFQGLLMAGESEFTTPEKVAMLWLHESERVYGDRLVSYEDLAKYKTLAQNQVKKRFPQFNLSGFFAAENADPLIFAHFADNIQDKVYDRITSMEKLRTTLEDALREYNESNATMDLVLFEDAMRHVCRISRIINNPAGHALLVGVGGSGKQSLSRLSAFICSYSVYQITISSTYSLTDLKDDLKAMYQKSGVKEEGIMFLFTDSQITNERFLVLINDLLASGDIPDLYAPEEVDEVVGALTARVKAAGIVPERKNVWEFFINEVRKNLHVVLCFSPVGDDFRNRATKFPALVNTTVIDWFQPWPREALYSVGKKFLASVDVGSDAVRAGIEEFFPSSFEIVNKAASEFMQTDRRYVYTTPKSYLELLKLYQGLLQRKRDDMEASINRLANGLQKLRETADQVVRIEEDLKVKLVAAEEKKTVSEGIAEEVAANKEVVEDETAKAEVEANKCATIAAEVTELQRNAEEDLAKAEPAVERAMAALDTLNKKDLSECKTMSTPPKGVDDIFAAVMVLLAGVDSNVPIAKNGKVKEKDRSWDSSKKALLGNINGFLDNLKGYKAQVDSYKVNDVNWKEIRPYLELEHFDPDIIATKNSAAAGLCSWVVNIVTYRDIVVTVEPKRQALREANEKLTSANTQLEAVQAKVADLQAKLNKLTSELNAANAEKQAAIDEVEQGQKKLDLAMRLTSALADENVRWAEGIELMSAEKELLVGDVLLASAFISYVGPFTKRYRERMVKQQWVPFLKTAAEGNPIPMSDAPNPVAILSDEAEIAEWNSQGLPNDPVSIENGAIVCNTARWPLMLDPQLQGIAWVREKEKDNGLVIVRLGQSDMLRKLEHAIDNGIPVLIENMGEKIDAVLNPVIARATMKKGHKHFLKLGDKEVEFHKNFRLYLHTKLSNPHYPPEVQAETALINFTVTETGLEDQLLALVVGKERPDLAEAKTALIKQQNQFKIKMKKLEDDILARLAAAEGDITEDVELIEGLEATKRIANDIQEKVVVAKQTETLINITAEKYRDVAARGSLLFFLMNELFRVHSYYIYSLGAFVVIFLRAIDKVSGDLNPMKAELDALEEGEEEEAEEEDELEASTAGDADAPAEGEGEAAEGEGAAAEGEEAAEEGEGEGAEGGSGASTPAAPAAPTKLKAGLSDEQLVRRCDILMNSITDTVFSYVNRGLFEVDKLTIATQLCFKILVKDGKLDPAQVMTLVMGPISTDPGAMGPLTEWMPEQLWPRVKALEEIKPELGNLGDDMQAESDAWKKWFDHEKPETLNPPAAYKGLSDFHRLLLLRAVRPDRLTAALDTFVSDNIGRQYVTQPPFDMAKVYEETSPSTPVFFVLFPGVDPTVWVEGLGAKLGITAEAGKFLNISMGQGQEAPAEAAIERFAKDGGWIMLQNVHLMQSWLPVLERKLELISETAHADFRCFISAEPPPMAHMKNMPESLMQTCIKIANEAPADLQSNLTRALANFDQDRVDACNKPTEFKACLFTLCFYHAIVLGRRRFGQQGWSKRYSFNTGDLTVCANVLFDYINGNDDVPWEDLRYIFGEIMYGGHITDAWDRRTNNTYLSVYLRPEILNGLELAEGFKVPQVATMSLEDMKEYGLNELPREAPPLYGLHPNAEIGYLISTADSLFKTIVSLEGAGGGAGGAGGGDVVRNTLEDLLERLPEDFVMIDIEMRAEPLLKEQTAPYVLVAMQECTRMNRLLSEVRRSLIELRKGLDGALNMSEPMEDLAQALSINQVPGRNVFHKASWEKLAWPSKKSLTTWFADVLARVEQLERWSSSLVLPYSMWLSGLFNPMAFLTAIMQITARQTSLPLDNMTTETHITTMNAPEEVTEYPESGAYVHGLFIEGARWAVGEEAGEPMVLGSTAVAGHLVDSRLKELLPALPLVYVRAVPVDPQWEPSDVGYLRHDPAVYECPIYTTTFRGPTYVTLATLKTLDPVSKWVRAGVAIVMQEDD